MVRQAYLSDVDLIAPRRQDSAELWAGYRVTPRQALIGGIENSDASFFTINGKPGGVFGCTDHGSLGVPWAIFTATIEKHPREFLRACRGPVEAMKAKHSQLMNYVDARNEKVKAWLQFMGFTLLPAEPFGVDQLPFHRFEWHV